MSERLFTPAQLAEHVGVSRQVIYLLIEAGKLAVVRFGAGKKSRIRIELSAWEGFVAAHRQPARVNGADVIVSRAASRASVADLPGASRYIQ